MTPSVVDASHDAGPLLSVRRARFTTRWESVGGKRAQAVEVTLDNLLPINAFSENTSITNPITIELSGTQLRTVKPAVINRLVASDRVRVDVLVADGASGNATVTVKDHTGNTLGQSDGWLVTPLPGVWSNDPSLLLTHETPTWWNEAKYGIFIHWGIYSYPAWAPPQQYAEWYESVHNCSPLALKAHNSVSWDLHNPSNSSSPTWEHHLQTYGPDVVYDDFIVNFTASKFNASSWVDLFDRAGAKYFVLVTKHHDGYALFDSGNTTHRASVYLGPGRDLVDELFTVAKKEKPNLHRGTYYSLPEWFNPDFAKYGFAEWPGGLAHNAFNASELEPYTGRLNISDYLQDLQLPQMLLLAQKYDTEIMWCDIGGPNMTLEFEAQFYNHAQAHGKQVTINNRCGVPQSDFDTPEYTKFNAIQTRKWETSEGMDPFSYGLNSATNASQYKNATTIVQSLVDIVSKNGNFLLDIGPNAEGEIIEAMSNNLLAAGEWLANSGDCVYATLSDH
ncbi:glycoside hydrolase [Punctularia strigosozonata HHB-11173 SS5]|uniref:glycoside hydrolase n=1 Tax=Punctularia strigosozonata (strain HHB-11173) TaxID=741275 RepID=UPI0004418374|nr:glycoside hydrolase [Punctularia strigosozonata HHB-11173 SS5]EIN06397.1 glycoside hydrolase [Punctularia strigosozonata HHB-11173 SS5]